MGVGEEIHLQATEVIEAAPVRPMPERRASREIEPWQRDAGTVALAAAGGAVAGIATVAAVRAARAGPRRSTPARLWRGRAREKVVASRSFLIDVHVLDR